MNFWVASSTPRLVSTASRSAHCAFAFVAASPLCITATASAPSPIATAAAAIPTGPSATPKATTASVAVAIPPPAVSAPIAPPANFAPLVSPGSSPITDWSGPAAPPSVSWKFPNDTRALSIAPAVVLP